jgi:hypothetical protein
MVIFLCRARPGVLNLGCHGTIYAHSMDVRSSVFKKTAEAG